MNLRRDVFQAIADPTRRAILHLLNTQSMTAGVIASNFDRARPTVSKHLLEEAKFSILSTLNKCEKSFQKNFQPNHHITHY
jgi:DNA-binding transcriptional ArsR family regulator